MASCTRTVEANDVIGALETFTSEIGGALAQEIWKLCITSSSSFSPVKFSLVNDYCYNAVGTQEQEFGVSGSAWSKGAVLELMSFMSWVEDVELVEHVMYTSSYQNLCTPPSTTDRAQYINVTYNLQ